MMPQALKTAILTEYGQDALACCTVVEGANDGHLPLGWGVVAHDSDPASGTYGSTIIVDPRYVVWCGDDCVWQTARWFAPKGQSWARRVLGDFGS